MQVEVRRNEALNGVEVAFSTKPGPNVRALLKSSGFRWSRRKELWYARYTVERLRMAEGIGRD